MRRAAWWSLVVAAVCVAAAMMSAAHVVVMTIDGFDDWSDSSAVPFDGAEHRVEVADGADALLWTWAGHVTPACIVRDAANGREVPLERATGWERPGGAMPYVAERAFTSPGPVVVRCERTSYDGALHVERRPLLPAPVHLFGASLVLGGIGVLAGLVGLGSQVVRPSRQSEPAEIRG